MNDVTVLIERCCCSNVFEEKNVLSHCRPEKKKFAFIIQIILLKGGRTLEMFYCKFQFLKP